MHTQVLYSIVIPVYNEESRIPKTIDAIFSFFEHSGVNRQIIFVDDGSCDRTKIILEQYRTKYDFIVVSYSENRGKGYAVREGVKHAQGDWIIFFDIDLATPLSEFSHLLKFLQPNDMVVIGSRRLQGAEIKKGESRLRTFLGRGFTKLSNILVPGITDFTCGFKCFSKAAVGIIFPRAHINRWGFDTELLYIAHLKKLSLREMPVAWVHDEDSRVNVGKAIISSITELGQIFLNRLKGLYH